MISDMHPGPVRKLRRGLPLAVAGAAMLLGGCVVPVPLPGPSMQRQGSMLSSDATCPADAALGPRFAQPVDTGRLNQTLLTEALRKIVNAERCRQGTTPLGLSAAAVGAAGGHAGSMAELNFMGHASPVRGRETMEQRLRAENAAYRLAGENVARGAASSLSAQRGDCLTGDSGPAPTYGDVARGFFSMWMDSPPHRENMLNPRFRALGAGIGINPQKYRCGELTAAMVLLG